MVDRISRKEKKHMGRLQKKKSITKTQKRIFKINENK